jgi:hypothetical protein
MSDYGARVVLPALMRLLREQAPGIDLVVSQGSREAMLGQLIDGETDLALGVFPELPAEVCEQVLFEESFVCLADRGTLPPRAGWTCPVAGPPHVLVAVRPGIDNEIDLALGALGARRRIALSLPHWGAAQGCSPVPTWCSRWPAAAWRAPAWTRLAPVPATAGDRAIHVLPGLAFASRGDAGHRWLRRQLQTLCTARRWPSASCAPITRERITHAQALSACRQHPCWPSLRPRPKIIVQPHPVHGQGFQHPGHGRLHPGRDQTAG